MSVYFKGKYYSASRIGQKLKRIRKKAKMNLSEIQEASSIVKSKLSYLENGKIKRPKIEDILKILDVLNADVEEVFTADAEEQTLNDTKYDEFILSLKLKIMADDIDDLSQDFNYLKEVMNRNSELTPAVKKIHGDYNYRKGNYEQALESYEEAIKMYAAQSKNNINYYSTVSMRNNTLYKLNRIELAKIKNIQLLQLIKEKTEPNDELYQRLYFSVNTNLALCLISLYDIEKAYDLLLSLKPKVYKFEPEISAHYFILLANIMYYKQDWAYFKSNFMDALHVISKCQNKDLIAKTLLGMYIVSVVKPKDVVLSFMRPSEFYRVIPKCTPACKNNPSFHRICHAMIHELINKMRYEDAKEVIVNLINQGHANSMTHFLAYKLKCLTQMDFVSRDIEVVLSEVENDSELLYHEKLYIFSTFSALKNENRLHPIQHLVEEVYLMLNNPLINHFLPEPLC